jgi:DNA polymerase-4
MSAQIIKTILHVDMDAFFASVEEVLNPNLKGRPMIVCGYSRRGVVSSPNYAARKFGIKAAMPVYHAVARCPNVVMQPPHFSEYEKFSNEFVSIIAKSFTKNIQKTSIDECYVDITSIISLGNDAIKIAKDIQKKIFNELGLTCSIGIAHNKFLAKMATDMNKPNGITTLYEDEIKQKL